MRAGCYTARHKDCKITCRLQNYGRLKTERVGSIWWVLLPLVLGCKLLLTSENNRLFRGSFRQDEVFFWWNSAIAAFFSAIFFLNSKIADLQVGAS
eukprot:symbB.v1.2.002300.t1/scaffold107.1/size327550/16